MSTFTGLDTELDLAEAYALECGGIDSEEALSERFDNEEAQAVIDAYGADDEPAPLAYDTPEQTVDNYLKGLTS